MPLLPCCFLSHNEDKPSVVLAASPRMQNHPKREQILSMECFGKGPCWVHLAQGKHNTEEADRMTSWLTSSMLLVLYSLTGFQQPHVRREMTLTVVTSLHQEKIVNIACTGGIQTALISVWL